MTAIPTGTVTFDNFNTAMGASLRTPRKMSEMYGFASGVPTSGTIRVSDLRGKSRGDRDFIYTTPGTYNWTCPQNVTSVHVVCVGAGGGPGSGFDGGDDQAGGGGGGLGYRNNIAVTSLHCGGWFRRWNHRCWRYELL